MAMRTRTACMQAIKAAGEQAAHLLVAGHVQQSHGLLGHEGQVVAEQVLVLLGMHEQLRPGQLVGLCRLEGDCASTGQLQPGVCDDACSAACIAWHPGVGCLLQSATYDAYR